MKTLTEHFLPLYCTNSSFRVLWPSPRLWLPLRLLTWPGRLLCMDFRKLHFGMIGIEIMTMCIHALLQVSFGYCGLCKLFPWYWSINWQCNQRIWRLYDDYVCRFRRNKVVLVSLTCHKGSVCVRTRKHPPICMHTHIQRAEHNLFWWKCNNGEMESLGRIKQCWWICWWNNW